MVPTGIRDGVTTRPWRAFAFIDPVVLERAVDMQARSYRLLRWLADEVATGRTDCAEAWRITNGADALEAFVTTWHQCIPSSARVADEELATFCRFFRTYLTNSFDFDPFANWHRAIQGAEWGCRTTFRELKPKRPTSAEKHRARKLCVGVVTDIAAGHHRRLVEADISSLLEDRHRLELSALVAYGHDLVKRLDGVGTGPEVLALWRLFAWLPTGSPRKGFTLTAGLILDAERKLAAVVCAADNTASRSSRETRR